MLTIDKLLDIFKPNAHSLSSFSFIGAPICDGGEKIIGLNVVEVIDLFPNRELELDMSV